MKHQENTSIYNAERGKLIIRKADDFIMGPDIDLGSADSIDNYEERSFTNEEITAFCEEYGLDPERYIIKEEEPEEEQNNI